MPDTVFPYDDEVVDPYSDDDTKNPHEESEEQEPEEDDDEKPAPRRGRPRKSAS